MLCTSGVIVGTAWAQPFRPVVVSGHSMEPTYENGSIVIEKRFEGPLKKGDVVVVDHDGSTIIKRVAKVPGEVYREYFYVGTWSPIQSESIYRWAKHKGIPIRWTSIPVDSVYILGDNSMNSTDSRYFGPVPLSEVRGKLVNPRSYDSDAVEAYQYKYFGALTD